MLRDLLLGVAVLVVGVGLDTPSAKYEDLGILYFCLCHNPVVDTKASLTQADPPTCDFIL